MATGISILKRLISGGERSSQDTRRPPAKIDDAFQTIQDDQPLNPYTEALLLHGHSGSILHVCTADTKRFVTVSEDTLVIVWDAETGCRLQTLRGHTAAVTCALSLHLSSDKALLMTGSLDNTLRLWNLSLEEMVMLEGPCVRVITEHDGAVQCLTQLGHNLVCSGGHDLCLWDSNGALLDKFDRSLLQDTSDVHSVLRLDTTHLSVVAASHYKCLAVFDIEKPMLMDRGCYHFKRDQKRRYLNQSHNYPITFLSRISASFFASGCQGGSIIVWSVQHLSALKIFYCLPQLQAKEVTTTEFAKVSCVEVVGERFVFAAVGCGFRMYDVMGLEKDGLGHPKPLVSHTCAHLLPLTSLTFLQERAQLVTVAEDRTVRLWGSPSRQRRETEGTGLQLQAKSAIETFIGVSRKGATVVPMLLGELHLHAGAIKVLMSVEEHGLVTGGEDGSIILWKDGERERERRDRDMHCFILGQTQLPE